MRVKNREQYVVTVIRPDRVSVKELAEYIREAVECWRGQFRLDDPMFDMQVVTKVKRSKCV